MKIIFAHIMGITEEEFEQMLIDYEKECDEVMSHRSRYRAIIQKRWMCIADFGFYLHIYFAESL